MKTFIALLFVLLSCDALADDAPRWYMFIEGGATRSTATTSLGDTAAAATAEGFNLIGSSESRGETSLTLGAGYQITPRIAVEGSWLDTGQLHQQSVTFTSGPNSGNRVKEWEASAYGIAAVGNLPLGRGFAALGKIAVYRVDGDYRTNTLILAPPPSNAIVLRTRESSSGSATVPSIGLGLSYQVMRELEARGMIELWQDKSGAFGEGNDLERIRIVTIGAAYRF